MRTVSRNDIGTSKQATFSQKSVSTVGIDMHTEHGFSVTTGTSKCLVEGETGTIAADHDLATEAGLQILLNCLTIQPAKWRVLQDVTNNDTAKCYAGGAVRRSIGFQRSKGVGYCQQAVTIVVTRGRRLTSLTQHRRYLTA